MAKLTRTQRAGIERALYHAKRAEKYVFADNVAVCARMEAKWALSGPQGDYTRPDGKALRDMQREYGSDLCGLRQSILELESILNPIVEIESI